MGIMVFTMKVFPAKKNYGIIIGVWGNMTPVGGILKDGFLVVVPHYQNSWMVNAERSGSNFFLFPEVCIVT